MTDLGTIDPWTIFAAFVLAAAFAAGVVLFLLGE
jgi:hypothetical protein